MGLFGSGSKVSWQTHQTGKNRYFRSKTKTLFEATEALNAVSAIPGLTYYIVETPDGNLGRDCESFYTEAPLKTSNLRLQAKDGVGTKVEFKSMVFPGNMMLAAQMVAQLRAAGAYAKLVFMMKCGRCDYESPVEAEAGTFTCQCYKCGATNSGSRANITTFVGGRPVTL